MPGVELVGVYRGQGLRSRGDNYKATFWVLPSILTR